MKKNCRFPVLVAGTLVGLWMVCTAQAAPQSNGPVTTASVSSPARCVEVVGRRPATSSSRCLRQAVGATAQIASADPIHVERFIDGLAQACPELFPLGPRGGRGEFQSATQRIVMLRQVHDHLDQRVDALVLQMLADPGDCGGALGLRVDQPSDLEPAMKQALAADRPVVINVRTDPDIMAPRVGS